MSMKVVVAIVLVIVLLGGGYLLLNGNKASYNTSQPSSTATTGVTLSKNVVTLTPNGWDPATLTIKAGQTVTWENKSGIDGAVYSVPHPIHNAYPPLNLGTFPDGGTLSLTFDNPGTYGYHNHLNPSQTGTIVVQ